MSSTFDDLSSIVKIAEGHPTLTSAGFLALDLVVTLSGINVEVLLHRAAEGRLALYVRLAGAAGYLVPRSALERDDPELGTVIVPNSDRMPAGAIRHLPTFPLAIPRDSLNDVVARMLDQPDSPVSLVGFDVDDPTMIFVPDQAVTLVRRNLQVAAADVERIRTALAGTIAPARLEAARTALAGARAPAPHSAGKHARRPLSEALMAYAKYGLAQAISSALEAERKRAGCNLLIELGGDVAVGEVDGDWLRHFRDHLLSTVPSQENKVRLKYKTSTVAESIQAVAGTGWAPMSPGERDKRMTWIRAWFRWLKAQDWIAVDPGLAVAGESVLSATEARVRRKRDDQARQPFEPEHLHAIFSTPFMNTGLSVRSRSGARKNSPSEYWLPLIALFTGARISELCQLHLDDILQTPAGTWYFDFNERRDDQRLKTVKKDKASPSARVLSIHPTLIALRLIEWIQALQGSGFRRLFPDLIHSGWDKGYSKASVKWFSAHMARLGYERNGTLTFHSFRHTFVNALPADTPERLGNQLSGHERGQTVKKKRYEKDQNADVCLSYVERVKYEMPPVAAFQVEDGLLALQEALARKHAHRKGKEDIGVLPKS